MDLVTDVGVEGVWVKVEGHGLLKSTVFVTLYGVSEKPY